MAWEVWIGIGTLIISALTWLAGTWRGRSAAMKDRADALKSLSETVATLSDEVSELRAEMREREKQSKEHTRQIAEQEKQIALQDNEIRDLKAREQLSMRTVADLQGRVSEFAVGVDILISQLNEHGIEPRWKRRKTGELKK